MIKNIVKKLNKKLLTTKELGLLSIIFVILWSTYLLVYSLEFITVFRLLISSNTDFVLTYLTSLIIPVVLGLIIVYWLGSFIFINPFSGKFKDIARSIKYSSLIVTLGVVSSINFSLLDLFSSQLAFIIFVLAIVIWYILFDKFYKKVSSNKKNLTKWFQNHKYFYANILIILFAIPWMIPKTPMELFGRLISLVFFIINYTLVVKSSINKNEKMAIRFLMLGFLLQIFILP